MKNLATLLEEELDLVENHSKIEEIEYLINKVCSELPLKNHCGKKIESIKNLFLRDVKRTKNFEIKKSRLIKFIIEIEINDLDVVEQLYNLFDFPFNYKENKLSNIYDEALYLLLTEVELDKPLEDTFERMPEEEIDGIQTNLQKYRFCVLRFIKKIIELNKEDSNYIKFINDLYLKLNFSSDDNEYIDSELEYAIFYESEYADEIESIYDQYVDQFDETSYKKIEFSQFKFIIYLSLLEKLFIPKTSLSNPFRRMIDESKHSYVLSALINTINYDDDFSYNFLATVYNEIFLDDDYLNKHKLFINYFTDVLFETKKLFNYKELKLYTKTDLKKIVTEYKEIIDKKYSK